MARSYSYSLIIVSAMILTTIHTHATASINAVCVFRREEIDLHKYSAILAAIKPIRRQLDLDIKKALNPIDYIIHKIKGSDFEVIRRKNQAKKHNQNRELNFCFKMYDGKLDHISRSFQMLPETFNNMSVTISKNAVLKSKVLMQSYYYRVSADLNTNTKPLKNSGIISNGIIEFQNRKSITENLEIPLIRDKETEKTVFPRFCKTVKMIEEERLYLRERLKTELGITRLPDNMCRPSVKPAMCKQVRTAQALLPEIVKRIVHYHGFQYDEFDDLYERTKHDAIFRYRINREINKMKLNPKLES